MIPATHLGNLLIYASYLGGDVAQIRQDLVVPDQDVCDPQKWVSEQEFLTVLEAVQQISKDEIFGWHYAQFLNIKALGIIFEVSQNAHSVKQALLLLQNYLKEVFPIANLEIWEDSTNLQLQLSSKIQNPFLNHQVKLMLLGFMARELALILPKHTPIHLTAPFDMLKSNIPKLSIKKGKRYTITLSHFNTEQQLNPKNLRKINELLPAFLKLLEQNPDKQRNFTSTIKQVVLNLCRPELPNFDEVAAQLPLSKRSIQRKLKEENTSFRKISNIIKQELYQYLHQNPKLKTQDLALLLGFSSSSALIHALNSWEIK